MEATSYIMEESANLHFSWAGDDKGLNDHALCLLVNGTECVSDWDYQEGFDYDIPINGTTLAIEVKIGKKGNEKKTTHFKHEFEIEPNSNYSAALEGKCLSFTGLKLKLSKPNENVEDDTPSCYNNAPIAILSFCFPIYGIFRAIRSSYNRKASIYGAAIGFILAMVFSAAIPEGYETGIGFGRTMLISFEPFSFLDWLTNLLVGGIASLRGLLYLLLDALF